MSDVFSASDYEEISANLTGYLIKASLCPVCRLNVDCLGCCCRDRVCDEIQAMVEAMLRIQQAKSHQELDDAIALKKTCEQEIHIGRGVLQKLSEIRHFYDRCRCVTPGAEQCAMICGDDFVPVCDYVPRSVKIAALKELETAYLCSNYKKLDCEAEFIYNGNSTNGRQLLLAVQKATDEWADALRLYNEAIEALQVVL